MGVVFNSKKLAGATCNGAKVAGIAYNGLIVWRPGPFLDYQPLYVTDWTEYSANTTIGAQTGWARPSTNSAHQVVTVTHSGGMAVTASGTSSNNRVNRTPETPFRATTYSRCKITALQTATATYTGVTFHGGSGSSTAHFAGISWNGSAYRLYVGRVGGRTSDSVTLLGVPTGYVVPQTGPWTVEARAIGMNTVEVSVNGELVTTMDTSGASGSNCGLFVRDAPNARVTDFEFGNAYEQISIPAWPNVTPELTDTFPTNGNVENFGWVTRITARQAIITDGVVKSNSEISRRSAMTYRNTALSGQRQWSQFQLSGVSASDWSLGITLRGTTTTAVWAGFIGTGTWAFWQGTTGQTDSGEGIILTGALPQELTSGDILSAAIDENNVIYLYVNHIGVAAWRQLDATTGSFAGIHLSGQNAGGAANWSAGTW